MPLGHKLQHLEPQMVMAENLADGREKKIVSDYVILSLGNRPSGILFRQLRGKLDRVIQEGDSISVGRIAQAVQSGF